MSKGIDENPFGADSEHLRILKAMKSAAYTNPKHPDHGDTSDMVRKYFERHGTGPDPMLGSARAPALPGRAPGGRR